MPYRVLADVLVVLHLLFVLFVVLGGLLVLRRRRWAWAHLPAAVWGALIEFGNWVCPLTPLENRLRLLGGEAGYRGGFVEEYVIPLLYPGQLTRTHQIVLGCLVVFANLLVYVWVYRKAWRKRSASGGGAVERLSPPE